MKCSSLAFGCLVLVLLAACNAPGPGMRAAPALLVTEGPSRFLMRRAGNEAEFIRTSVEPVPSTAAVALRADRALRRLTGCRAGWISGDAAVLRMGLDCPDAGRTPPPPTPPAVDCLVIDEYRTTGAVFSQLALDCDGIVGDVTAAAH